jgi:hypothetical protein
MEYVDGGWSLTILRNNVLGMAAVGAAVWALENYRVFY